MVRVAGVELPKNKRLFISLQSIYGVGKTTALKICAEANLSPTIRAKELFDEDFRKIRECLDTRVVEGDLRTEVAMNIKRLIVTKCYRGLRHKSKLPMRSRTHSNGRTRKGPAKPIAGKKK